MNCLISGRATAAWRKGGKRQTLYNTWQLYWQGAEQPWRHSGFKGFFIIGAWGCICCADGRNGIPVVKNKKHRLTQSSTSEEALTEVSAMTEAGRETHSLLVETISCLSQCRIICFYLLLHVRMIFTPHLLIRLWRQLWRNFHSAWMNLQRSVCGVTMLLFLYFFFLTFHMYLLAWVLPSLSLNLSVMSCALISLPVRRRGKDDYCYERPLDLLAEGIV